MNALFLRAYSLKCLEGCLASARGASEKNLGCVSAYGSENNQKCSVTSYSFLQRLPQSHNWLARQLIAALRFLVALIYNLKMCLERW